jgi:hypothetical protein
MRSVWRLSCYLESGRHSRFTSILIALARTFNMLRKLSAASLVLLILSPFTAPFSTCDLATMLGTTDAHKSTDAHRMPVAPRRAPRRAPVSLTRDSAVSVVPSMIRRTVRIKPLAFSRRDASFAHSDLGSAPGRLADSARRFDTHSGLTTILRL